MTPSHQHPVEPRWRIVVDCLVAVCVVAVFATLSLMFQWSETLFKWLKQYEILDLDELALSMLMMLCCLTWFSWRRWRDVQHQLDARFQLQTQRDVLFDQNRELSQKILSAQEDERRILARELHDEVAQSCTAIRYEAAFIAKTAADQLQPVVECAARIENHALAMHQLTRQMLKRLRPENLDSLGFDQALRTLCQTWERQFGLVCHVNLEGAQHHDLSDYAKISLYRVVQEALINVARHAHATQAQVSLQAIHATWQLRVQDNGVGFDPTQRGAGLGLVGIQERIASLQGQAHWLKTLPGTCLICEIPRKVAQP